MGLIVHIVCVRIEIFTRWQRKNIEPKEITTNDRTKTENKTLNKKRGQKKKHTQRDRREEEEKMIIMRIKLQRCRHHRTPLLWFQFNSYALCVWNRESPSLVAAAEVKAISSLLGSALNSLSFIGTRGSLCLFALDYNELICIACSPTQHNNNNNLLNRLSGVLVLFI